MNSEKGRRGEDQACAWLTSEGFVVIERNWRVRAGEIDVIATKDQEIVFVEVKSRKTNLFGGAVSSLSERRIERLRNAALVYISEHDKFQYFKISLKLLAIQNGKILEIDLI